MKYAKPITLISGLVLALSLPVSSALADSATVNAEKSANIRSGAGMNHPVIAWVMKGDSVEVLERSGKWSKVQLENGKTGYIYTALLSTGSSATPSTGVKATIQAEKSVNVRAGAGMNYPVVAWAMKGDSVEVLERSGKWSKVQLENGKTGYVYTALLSTGSSSAPSAPGAATGNAVIVTKNASSTVNLRESKNGKIIAALKSGVAVTVIRKDGDWYQVKAGSLEGYVYATYIQEGVAAQTTGDVHLRSGAGTGYRVLAILKKGTPVTVLEKNGKWVKVLANGQTGYIHSAYCSK